MRSTPFLTLIVTGLTLGACADFYSIGRSRVLPDDPSSNKGLAIHLDAQQRLMMVSKNGDYCAEASPDAMAAYAAALAASVAAQGSGSGALSSASQSNIASIGLRTQSITLMRDALYRLCEAGANGQLSEISQTQLMARSQDLTAVVVAVEQLTGATAASQALLTGTSSANAAATAIGGADQLDAADKNLERKTAARQKAEEDLLAKDAEIEKQKPISDTARNDANSAAEDLTDAQKQTLKDRADAEETKLAILTREQKNLQTRVANAKEAETRAQEIVEKVAAAGAQADASSSAATTGAGQFAGTNPSRDNLTDASSKEIAKSVETMVTTVLNKDYTGADCMFLLTNMASMANQDRELLNTTVEQCKELLKAKINAESAKYLAVSANYIDMANAADPIAAKVRRVQAAITANPGLVSDMNTYLATKGNVTLADVLTNSGTINNVDLPPLLDDLITRYNIP